MVRTEPRVGVACLIIATVSMSACSMFGSSPEIHSIGSEQALLTDASYRAIIKFNRNDDYVICAEPSPDVAKALSEGFSVGLAGALQGVEGATPEASASLGRSAAESLAQLGERLATIQLLRDALFRACEAYANGALSETAYAILLSRYDDTMVTLLTSELAAGAFGRSLATLSSESSGKS